MNTDDRVTPALVTPSASPIPPIPPILSNPPLPAVPPVPTNPHRSTVPVPPSARFTSRAVRVQRSPR